MPRATVLIDSYAWVTGEGDNSETHDAVKGDVIEVSSSELERGLGMLPQGLAEGEVDVRKDRQGAEAIVGAGASSNSDSDEKLPRTQKALDALAAERGVEWPQGTKTVAQKQEALRAAASPSDPAEGEPPLEPVPATNLDLPDDLLSLDESELIPLAQDRGVSGAEEMSRDELIGEILGAPGAGTPLAPLATKVAERSSVS